MRIIVAPDSFKGSLSAAEASAIIAEEFRLAGHEVVTLPMADGGEGTVAAFAAAVGGERRTARVAGPYGEPVDAEWALLADGSAAVELAAAAGLPLVGSDRRTEDATTLGLGELILTAARSGARRILVGLGGSASTDGGCGAAAACGVRFLSADGEAFVPTGATLPLVDRIDVTRTAPELSGVLIEALLDVDNPLIGPRGAAAVFGPQKGASPDLVAELDAGLAHLAGVIERDLGIAVAELPGGGAAGGAGAGLHALLGAVLRPGADALLDAVGFEDLLQGADAVVTGEGSFDGQSLAGKAVVAIARLASGAGVPVRVLAGRVEADPGEAGIASATAIAPDGMPAEEALARAGELLATAARALAEELARRPEEGAEGKR